MVQLENAKLKDELKRLKLLTNSQIVEAKNVNPRQRIRESVPEALEKFDRDIALYGCKDSLMVSPWILATVIAGASGRPDVDPLGNARFDKKDKKAMQEGILAELYDFLPKHLHDVMENHSYFVSIVS